MPTVRMTYDLVLSAQMLHRSRITSRNLLLMNPHLLLTMRMKMKLRGASHKDLMKRGSRSRKPTVVMTPSRLGETLITVAWTKKDVLGAQTGIVIHDCPLYFTGSAVF